jgi:DNA-binding transcriptional MocR family regulator
MDECKKVGSENMLLMFCSTSKLTYPGAGVACMSSSVKNIDFIKKQMFFQSIGPDKINQLRHVKYFGTSEKIYAHMQKHADILKPKFDAVLNTLNAELSGLGIANWVKPHGGYFISLDVQNGCAKRTLALAAEAGVVMTAAGSTYPYKKDPNDSNIRIAPTYPKTDELNLAAKLLCICVKLACAEKLIEGK